LNHKVREDGKEYRDGNSVNGGDQATAALEAAAVNKTASKAKDNLPLVEYPLQGKTYSLFGTHDSSDYYYRLISDLADRCANICRDPRDLLNRVQMAGKSRGRLRSYERRPAKDPLITFILQSASEIFHAHTRTVASHLKTLPFKSRWDKTLAASDAQYHFFMLEVELTNRLHAEDFRKMPSRMAFLPHCLRDWSRACRAKADGVDLICRRCSPACWIHAVSRELQLQQITPYIWMTANLSRLFRKLKRNGDEIGVMGIACLPELVHGMRLCMRHRIPVVGVPLNANRCARWMGHFLENSVNMGQIRRLI
jgi:hypothetical protein